MRAGVSVQDMLQRFPRLGQWESGELRPTLNQVEKFAATVNVPVGYLFLPEPPDEPLPIPDHRTSTGETPPQPSPELLKLIYLCDQRQDWYREFAQQEDLDPSPVVGSASPTCRAEDVGAEMRASLRFDVGERGRFRTWQASFRHLVEMADDLGILVMVSGSVGYEPRRMLDPREFRGFAFSDSHAPLVFINGTESREVQLFTLVNGLAHLWVGQSALWDSGPNTRLSHKIEFQCSLIAAETLLPLRLLKNELLQAESLSQRLKRLAHKFKVNELIVLCRLHDAGDLNRCRFHEAYESESARLKSRYWKKSGDDLYGAYTAGLGHLYSRALVCSTLEGRTLYRDASHLIGVPDSATFERLASGRLPFL